MALQETEGFQDQPTHANPVQSEGLRASEQCNIGIFQGGIAVGSASQDIGRSCHAHHTNQSKYLNHLSDWGIALRRMRSFGFSTGNAFCPRHNATYLSLDYSVSEVYFLTCRTIVVAHEKRGQDLR